eukprot:TRINITY_DN6339_c0_g1_i1.p1 TRINITY_DN6339_c0_g1~~TRINITY_DN6339_c0_g1_i1.p1  ORF type:complete len:443 (-),score=84.52 TRINITY_DN6339_c0_g1_i1:165-1493(-)
MNLSASAALGEAESPWSEDLAAIDALAFMVLDCWGDSLAKSAESASLYNQMRDVISRVPQEVVRDHVLRLRLVALLEKVLRFLDHGPGPLLVASAASWASHITSLEDPGGAVDAVDRFREVRDTGLTEGSVSAAMSAPAGGSLIKEMISAAQHVSRLLPRLHTEEHTAKFQVGVKRQVAQAAINPRTSAKEPKRHLGTDASCDPDPIEISDSQPGGDSQDSASVAGLPKAKRRRSGAVEAQSHASGSSDTRVDVPVSSASASSTSRAVSGVTWSAAAKPSTTEASVFETFVSQSQAPQLDLPPGRRLEVPSGSDIFSMPLQYGEASWVKPTMGAVPTGSSQQRASQEQALVSVGGVQDAHARRGLVSQGADAEGDSDVFRGDIPKKVRTYNPWTAEEERRLIAGYNKYGKSWEMISKTCNLRHRTPVQLKDKWRNLSKARVL